MHQQDTEDIQTQTDRADDHHKFRVLNLWQVNKTLDRLQDDEESERQKEARVEERSDRLSSRVSECELRRLIHQTTRNCTSRCQRTAEVLEPSFESASQAGSSTYRSSD